MAKMLPSTGQPMAGRSRNSLYLAEPLDAWPSRSGVFLSWWTIRRANWRAGCLVLTASSGSDQDEGCPWRPTPRNSPPARKMRSAMSGGSRSRRPCGPRCCGSCGCHSSAPCASRTPEIPASSRRDADFSDALLCSRTTPGAVLVRHLSAARTGPGDPTYRASPDIGQLFFPEDFCLTRMRSGRPSA